MGCRSVAPMMKCHGENETQIRLIPSKSSKINDRLFIFSNRYPYVCHAEMNAILNKNCADVRDGTICKLKYHFISLKLSYQRYHLVPMLRVCQADHTIPYQESCLPQGQRSTWNGRFSPPLWYYANQIQVFALHAHAINWLNLFNSQFESNRGEIVIKFSC